MAWGGGWLGDMDNLAMDGLALDSLMKWVDWEGVASEYERLGNGWLGDGLGMCLAGRCGCLRNT
jgi:hypothetical protein